MIRLILAVSLRRCRSLPKAFIQGFSAVFVLATSLSLTASVTYSRNGIPRSAAADLARRNMVSGISKVVFMPSYSHIYLWEKSQNRPSAPDRRDREGGMGTGV